MSFLKKKQTKKEGIEAGKQVMKCQTFDKVHIESLRKPFVM